MRDGVDLLTEREKEALRLLLGGHDAKSAARRLGLSVHTVNERLRDARRKLGVSSSREAARMLAGAERAGPDFVGDKGMGVSGGAAGALPGGRAGGRLAWFGGGMMVMSLVVAAVALSSVSLGSSAPEVSQMRTPAPAAVPKPAGLGPARDWVALLDRGRWEESWRAAAGSFRAAVPAAQWALTIRAVRPPLGPVSARALLGATKTTSLPGAPTGEYEVIQFKTSFARKADAVETVTVVREGGGWRVAGYFIR